MAITVLPRAVQLGLKLKGPCGVMIRRACAFSRLGRPMASSKDTPRGWRSPQFPERPENRGWKSPRFPDPSSRQQPNTTLSGFLWWLAQRTTRAEFEAHIEALVALIERMQAQLDHPAMALDAKLQKGLERVLKNLGFAPIDASSFDQPVKRQNATAQFLRATYDMPAHAGGRSTGRSEHALEARRRIDALAASDPSWRDLSFPEIIQHTSIKADLIDKGKLHQQTVRDVLRDAKRERED
jgi:hypothetical protein